jgi:hypothetical protein
MNNATQQIVNKAWNFAHVLRDDGLSYMADTEQITFLLFLKMADVKGDIYEGLLSKSAAESPKGAGQYFTPRELIKADSTCTRCFGCRPGFFTRRTLRQTCCSSTPGPRRKRRGRAGCGLRPAHQHALHAQDESAQARGTR